MSDRDDGEVYQFEHNAEFLDTENVLAAYLYRVDDGNGYYYGSVREVQAGQNVELVGVATRYAGDKFRGGTDYQKFRQKVQRLAREVCWFDEPVPTQGGIAEYLYRTTWSEDRKLYAATRQEVEYTRREIIGVVVRPPRVTVESTKWGRGDFERNVVDVADRVVWFGGGQTDE